jgi:hypothetical protein
MRLKSLPVITSLFPVMFITPVSFCCLGLAKTGMLLSIIIRGEKENTSIFTKISDIFQKKTENSPAERKNHRKRKFLLPSERKTAIIDICVKIT